MRVRVGFIDDHPSMIIGVASMLGKTPDLVLAGAAASVTELLARQLPLDVVLLDLLLADGSTPTENISALRAAGVRVLVFTSGERPALLQEASRAGLDGMIRKSAKPEAIVQAIRQIARGQEAPSADWAAALDADDEFVSARLSTREAEVLALYAAGETAERVAAELFISKETVLDHIRRVRRKYSVAGRPAPTKVDLHRRAVEDGLLGPGSG